MKKIITAALTALLCAASLSACAKSESRPAEETTAATASETTTTTEQTTTTVTTTAETTTAAAETTTAPDTAAADSTDTTADSAGTAPAPADGAAKLLWSERGLEAVPADSEGGYGEPLEAGAEYLGWTLKSYAGAVSGDSVSEMKAEFSRGSALSVNGIMTVLASSDADNPNGLYLRVDNQADFPYFPSDTRDRGWFIIENKEDVYEWLELDEPPVSASYTIAVTVDVTALRVDLRTGGYDTITVTSASKR